MGILIALVLQAASILLLVGVTIKHKKYRQGKTNEVVGFIMLSVAAISLALAFDSDWTLLFFGAHFALIVTALILAIKADSYASSNHA